jgi:hypothetical protein
VETVENRKKASVAPLFRAVENRAAFVQKIVETVEKRSYPHDLLKICVES